MSFGAEVAFCKANAFNEGFQLRSGVVKIRFNLVFEGTLAGRWRTLDAGNTEYPIIRRRHKQNNKPTKTSYRPCNKVQTHFESSISGANALSIALKCAAFLTPHSSVGHLHCAA
jgi:hypothetical protein